MLKTSNKPWTIATLVNTMDKNKIDFNLAFQRGLVWNDDQKSLLIDSAITGFPIPTMFFQRQKGDIYCALDGKQRSNAFYSYINDEFPLSDLTVLVPPDDSDEDDANTVLRKEISGKKFSELRPEIQQAIKDCTINITYVDDASEKDVTEMFFRLNNGKSLTAFELTKVKARGMKEFKRISECPALLYAVSDAGKQRDVDLSLAMQAWCICFVENPSFMTKEFRPTIINTEVTEDQTNFVLSCFDMINELYGDYDPETPEHKKILRTLKAKSHIISLVYIAKLCKQHGIEKDFKSIVGRFFETKGKSASISEDYNKVCAAWSGKPENLKIRTEILEAFVKSAQS